MEQVVFGELPSGDTGRICGHCQMCCTLLPVYDMHRRPKMWNVKCSYQRKGNKGCTIYPDRPPSCKAWSCAWLTVPETDFPRPDQAHYIVDTFVTRFGITEYGEYEALQVWVDPKWPDAWMCTKLLPWLAKMAEDHRYATVVRLKQGADQSILLFPPALDPLIGEWTGIDTRQGMVDILPTVYHFKGLR